MDDTALSLLIEVATSLGDLVDRVVFIGGAVVPLLQVERPFPSVRRTDDVDAIVASAGYADFEAVRQALRKRGFREPISAPHLHRWITPRPAAIPFDLVPSGAHAGSSGNPWDALAIETAVRTEISPRLFVRHASAPAFLALKFAAFADRGSDEPRSSEDLEDILALIASRPGIVEEIAEAPPALRGFVASRRTSFCAISISSTCSAVT